MKYIMVKKVPEGHIITLEYKGKRGRKVLAKELCKAPVGSANWKKAVVRCAGVRKLRKDDVKGYLDDSAE